MAIWVTNGSTALQSLLITQTKAIRIITGSTWNAHTKPLFAKLKILTVHDIHKLQVALCLFMTFVETEIV